MKVNNPRFPHTCKVYRISGETLVWRECKEIVYQDCQFGYEHE